MAKKVLIIDDEKDMRVYLEAIFRKEGFETETAANGEEGLWLAEANRPDLITLDVLMPKKSGVKAYRGLRSSEATNGIPIIVLTGLTRLDDFFGDLGDLPRPDALVEKPIDRNAFLKEVVRLVGAA
ncbi:MAG: response regulator [Thermoanaerobaculales bacterium]|jgi:DNA-binding response OmpR family regulator|nr:response regulator [Thermoanaerobaculales bacterium]